MVDTKHPDYDKHFPDWKLIRDTIEGDLRAYVPKLEGQSKDEFNAYVDRPSFYNATSRTLDALVGLMFSKPPEFIAPKELEEIAKNITLNGESVEEFAKIICKENLQTARGGVMVDMPNVYRGSFSKADEEKLKLRTYARYYNAESIINWDTISVNGIEVLTQVVLEEGYLKTTNEFTKEAKTRWRVLDLFEGVYRQRVFEDSGTGTTKNILQVSEVTPIVNGSTINYIPFVFIGITSLKPLIEKSPILDLVKVNVSHFKNEVDLEHGAHFTALPTAWIAGYQPAENEVLKIGSTSVWIFSEPSAKAEYLEFKGDGLQTLEKRSEVKEKRMATLGARLLLDEKKTAEATETVAMRSSGERAVLISSAITISQGIKKVLELIAEWEQISGDVSFEINTDYNLTTIDPQLLAQLMAGVQGGIIPLQVLYYNIKQGELMPDEIDSYETYQGANETAQPQLSVTTSTKKNSVNDALKKKLNLQNG